MLEKDSDIQVTIKKRGRLRYNWETTGRYWWWWWSNGVGREWKLFNVVHKQIGSIVHDKGWGRWW